VSPSVEERVEAVRQLIDYCRKISPHPIIEVEVVERALDHGRMPDMTSQINIRKNARKNAPTT
jgi:hypothetical protein